MKLALHMVGWVSRCRRPSDQDLEQERTFCFCKQIACGVDLAGDSADVRWDRRASVVVGQIFQSYGCFSKILAKTWNFRLGVLCLILLKTKIGRVSSWEATATWKNCSPRRWLDSSWRFSWVTWKRSSFEIAPGAGGSGIMFGVRWCVY